MPIAYQPEIVEERKVDGWPVLPPLPAKLARPTPCDDEVSGWFVADWMLPKHVVIPAMPPSSSLEERFREQADKWDRETAYLSSTPKMILHDSYQKIMAMGPDVVPFLLRDLQQYRRSWFWALRHLTNANPVPPEDQGNLDKMIAAWVAWGRRERHI